MSARARVLAISGGVGGAKLALGLDRILAAGELAVLVNTGDDFEHLGLHVSPDVDSVVYALANKSDQERGWGRAGESWRFMDALGELGGATWFGLGDLDLAMHVERSAWLRDGRTLTDFTAHVRARFGIGATVLPMTDDPVRTMVETPEGVLPFQRYFVERRCEPAILSLSFAGAAQARVNPAALAMLADPGLEAIVICPSNPYLSVDPILALPGLVDALKASAAPVVVVSPLIGGHAVKGPTAKIMAELGVTASTRAIAAHYEGLADGLVVDLRDGDEARDVALPVRATPTLMVDLDDRIRLARETLAFAAELAAAGRARRRTA